MLAAGQVTEVTALACSKTVAAARGISGTGQSGADSAAALAPMGDAVRLDGAAAMLDGARVREDGGSGSSWGADQDCAIGIETLSDGGTASGKFRAGGDTRSDWAGGVSGADRVGSEGGGLQGTERQPLLLGIGG